MDKIFIVNDKREKLSWEDRQKLIAELVPDIHIVVKCCEIQEKDLRKACNKLGLDYYGVVTDLENDYDIVEEKGER